MIISLPVIGYNLGTSVTVFGICTYRKDSSHKIGPGMGEL
jgi:hypothetical protein